MRRTSLRIAGFALSFLLIVSGFAGRAEAGIVLGEPEVRSGGDPWYIYTTAVFLDSGFAIQPATGGRFNDPVDPRVDDFLTIYNIRGFTNVVGLFPNEDLTGGPITAFTGIGREAGTGYTPEDWTRPPVDAGYPDVGDVTMFMVRGYDPVVNTTGSTILLGYLAIQAWLPTGVDPTSFFEYSWQARRVGGGSESGGGVVNVVPGPSSLVLLGIAGSMHLARRLRARRPARADR